MWGIIGFEGGVDGAAFEDPEGVEAAPLFGVEAGVDGLDVEAEVVVEPDALVSASCVWRCMLSTTKHNRANTNILFSFILTLIEIFWL